MDVLALVAEVTQVQEAVTAVETTRVAGGTCCINFCLGGCYSAGQC
jgi:hypothetical protein